MTIVVYPAPVITQPVSAASLPLPANAAQETGGNLASSVALLTYLSRLVELNTLIIAELRALRLQQGAAYGTTVDPSHVIDDFAFN